MSVSAPKAAAPLPSSTSLKEIADVFELSLYYSSWELLASVSGSMLPIVYLNKTSILW